MKKLLTILLALALALALCACDKDTPAGGNTPDNVVPPNDDVTTSADTAEPEPNASSEVTTSLEDEEIETSTSAETPDEEATSPDDDEVVIDDEENENIAEVIDIHQFKAFEHLYLLNSDKVHAKFMEVVSYDGEYVMGIDREFFVDGTDAVYINDSQKIIITDELVTVIDMDLETYYEYENDHAEMEDNFGYGLPNYINVSVSEEDGVITEVFEIELYGSITTSTWVFYEDGSFTVSDVSEDSDGYYHYSFEYVTDDTSNMDMSVPSGLTEVSPDDYEGH